MLKLKLQYFGHLMGRVHSLEKTMMLGKIEGRKPSKWQMMRWLDGIIDSMDMNLSKLQETVEDRGAGCAAVHRVANSWTQLSDWTTLVLTPNSFTFLPSGQRAGLYFPTLFEGNHIHITAFNVRESDRCHLRAETFSFPASNSYDPKRLWWADFPANPKGQMTWVRS